MTKFCRFDLRTTDAEAARGFYTMLFGHDRARIWPLHEQALARGARPHWLGTLGVSDFERTVAAFLERGATPLGAVIPMADGSRAQYVHDPGGALVALSSVQPSDSEPSVNVVWHVLNANAAARAANTYCELFGWQLKGPVEVPGQGIFQEFAWQADAESVGAIGDIAHRPGVHPQWLFFFEVDALEPAIAQTLAAGGTALDPMLLPSGQRACVCEDPQGAAFGLRERHVARSGY